MGALYWARTIENDIEERVKKNGYTLIYFPTAALLQVPPPQFCAVFENMLKEILQHNGQKQVIIPDAHIITGLERKKAPHIIIVREILKSASRDADILCISPYDVKEVPFEIVDEFIPMEIPLPDYTYIKKTFPKYKYKEHLIGLTKRQMHYVVSLGLDAAEYQTAMFASNGFDIVRPQRSLATIGGYNRLKRWLAVRKPFFHKKDPLVKIKGIILFGAPGTGKSVICEAIAAELEIPFLKWNVSKIMSSLYGETERRIKSSLDQLRVLPAAVLQIDEIDKIFAGYESSFSCDAGTTARMLGVMQSWLAEQDNIFVIGTTNKPLHLDDAMVRKGRFNELFYVPLPDSGTRNEIINLYSQKYNMPELNSTLMTEHSESLTGAEIEAMIEELYILRKVENLQLTDEVITGICAMYRKQSNSRKYDQALRYLNYPEV